MDMYEMELHKFPFVDSGIDTRSSSVEQELRRMLKVAKMCLPCLKWCYSLRRQSRFINTPSPTTNLETRSEFGIDFSDIEDDTPINI